MPHFNESAISYYHLPYHHHIGSQVFVHAEDVQDPDVPEYDVNAVDDSAVTHIRFVLQPQHEPKKEGCYGHEVCDVPVLLQPNTYLLL